MAMKQHKRVFKSSSFCPWTMKHPHSCEAAYFCSLSNLRKLQQINNLILFFLHEPALFCFFSIWDGNYTYK